MKLWTGYGSEHSENLSMVGRFVSDEDAKQVEEALGRLQRAVQEEDAAGRLVPGRRDGVWSPELLEALKAIGIYTITSAEMEVLLADYECTRSGNDIHVWTDEIDVSAFLKVMLHYGGRIEVFHRPAVDEE